MARWPITAVAVGALLFASALEIHLHKPGRATAVTYQAAAGPVPVDVSPAERAALDRPDDVVAWVDLAEAYAGAGRYDEAVRAFGQAREIDPDHRRVTSPPNWASKTPVLDVERELLANPHDDEAWGRAAEAIANSGDDQRAISYYLRALKLDPSDSEWPGKLMALGPDPRIDRFITQWSAGAGDMDDEALGDIGDGLKSSGRWREACGFYARALVADPADSEWTTAMDECSRRFPGEFASAAEASLEAFARRVATDPRDDELLGDYGDALRAAGRMSEACEQFRRAAAIDPSDSEWTRATLACPGGLGDLSAMRSAAAGDDEQTGDLADVLWESGRVNEACQLYRDALRLDPSDDEWQAALRRCP